MRRRAGMERDWRLGRIREYGDGFGILRECISTDIAINY